MKETLTEINQITAVIWFYGKVKALKKKLPEKPQKLILNKLGAEYDSYEGAKIINGVLNLKTTDMAVLNAIEAVIIEKQIKTC